MIVCIANRCACNVQLFNYEEVLGDADRLLARIENLKQEERETPNIQSMRVKMLLRKGIACSWKVKKWELRDNNFLSISGRHSEELESFREHNFC